MPLVLAAPLHPQRYRQARRIERAFQRVADLGETGGGVALGGGHKQPHCAAIASDQP